jgi:hypothetical protein
MGSYIQVKAGERALHMGPFHHHYFHNKLPGGPTVTKVSKNIRGIMSEYHNTKLNIIHLKKIKPDNHQYIQSPFK